MTLKKTWTVYVSRDDRHCVYPTKKAALAFAKIAAHDASAGPVIVSEAITAFLGTLTVDEVMLAGPTEEVTDAAPAPDKDGWSGRVGSARSERMFWSCGNCGVAQSLRGHPAHRAIFGGAMMTDMTTSLPIASSSDQRKRGGP